MKWVKEHVKEHDLLFNDHSMDFVQSNMLLLVGNFLPPLVKITAWKVSVFGVFLVRIFPHLDSIRRDTDHFCIYTSTYLIEFTTFILGFFMSNGYKTVKRVFIPKIYYLLTKKKLQIHGKDVKTYSH